MKLRSYKQSVKEGNIMFVICLIIVLALAVCSVVCFVRNKFALGVVVLLCDILFIVVSFFVTGLAITGSTIMLR